MALCELLRLK
jgi:hypothetical protein